MIGEDFPLTTLPPRSLKDLTAWGKGDVVVIDGLRWRIEDITAYSVDLVSTNHPNCQLEWRTEPASLPVKR